MDSDSPIPTAASAVPAIGTHFPVLAAAAARTQGPILEMGAGEFSTPMLHLICLPSRRRLVTVESDAAWLAQYKDLETPWHSFHHVKEGEEDAFSLIDQIYWDVAFVDHRPGERRVDEIARLRDKALFIVVHDSEAECYHYEPVFETFPHRVDWKRFGTWTTVVSMKQKFEL